MIFRDRRRYVPQCVECGWNDSMPPFACSNDLCPKCHSEVVWNRIGWIGSWDALLAGRGEKQMEVLS